MSKVVGGDTSLAPDFIGMSEQHKVCALNRQNIMANRQGYDVVVDVDAEVSRSATWCRSCTKLKLRQGDLGHTDLNDDLEFHNSSEQYLARQRVTGNINS